MGQESAVGLPAGSGLWFDRDGNPIGSDAFAALCADHDYRFLARARVGRYEVVTAWLGRDQGPFADDTRPMIFGTAALDREAAEPGTLFEDREWFAATEADALAHHARLVERLSAATS